MKGNTFTAVVRTGGNGRADVQVDGLAPRVETQVPVSEGVGALDVGDIVIVEYANDGKAPIVTGRLSKSDVKNYNNTGYRSTGNESANTIEIGEDGYPTTGRAPSLNSQTSQKQDMPGVRALQRQTVDDSRVTGGLHILFGEDAAADRQSAAAQIKQLVTERSGVGLETMIAQLNEASAPRDAVRVTKRGQEMDY